MSMVWIASALGNNTTQTIFSNVPQTFTHLQVRAFDRSGTGYAQSNDLSFLRFNSDSGSNYRAHALYGDGGSVASVNSADTYIRLPQIPGNTGTANVFGSFVVDILDYTNTNKNKTVRAIGGFDLNGSGQAWLNSGVWFNTAAVTSITIGAGNWFDAVGSRFDLYGITSSQVTGI
jgi:hypothetical protein